MVLWLKGDTLGLSDGTSVSTWADSSGNGNDATQATGANQPVFKTAIVNGHDVVRFDATNDGMVTPLSVASPFSIFIVYDCATNGAARRAINGTNNYLIGPRGSAHQMYNGAFITGPAVTTNVFVQANALTDGSGTLFRVNAVAIGSNGNTLGPGTLGLATSGANAEVLAGDIAEVIVYNRILTSGERADVETYLAAKYGL
jgi:hypothetical protein